MTQVWPVQNWSPFQFHGDHTHVAFRGRETWDEADCKPEHLAFVSVPLGKVGTPLISSQVLSGQGWVAQPAQGPAALLTSCSPAAWGSSCPAGRWGITSAEGKGWWLLWFCLPKAGRELVVALPLSRPSVWLESLNPWWGKHQKRVCVSSLLTSPVSGYSLDLCSKGGERWNTSAVPRTLCLYRRPSLPLYLPNLRDV